MADKLNVSILGSGNWATTIARNVGNNVASSPLLEDTVSMYVYEEMVEGQKLTEIINTTHINVKYMPDYVLPTNVVACDNVVTTARDADILIFAIPPSFVSNCCKALLGKVKPTAHAVSLIKGFERSDDGHILLISHLIMRHLKIPCSVLVGCNLAHEISNNNFAEGTVGCRDQKYMRILYEIFKSDFFRVVVTDDADCVEICSTLRNIIAFGAGLADGMELNENTKAGIIRRGFLEILQFVDVFYPGSRLATFFESCGLSDLITSCYANRNRRLAEAFVKSGKPLSELEYLLLPGHEVLGPVTAELINIMLKKKGLEEKYEILWPILDSEYEHIVWTFPLFTCIYRICTGAYPLTRLLETLRFAREDIYHPNHMFQL